MHDEQERTPVTAPETGEADSAAVTRTDPKALTSQELSDIRRRVQRGEKIRF